MGRVRANYGGGICRKCGMTEETTEHALACQSDGLIQYAYEVVEDVGWLRKAVRIMNHFEQI